MNRRKLLVQGLLTCACCLSSVAARSNNIVISNEFEGDGSELPLGGCFLLPKDVKNKSIDGEAFPSEDEQLLATGNSEDDRRLGRALVRSSKFFSVNPAFGFYNDMNAQASPALAKNINGTWGTVLFGHPLYRSEMTRDRSGLTVLAIIAHEFGHIVQFKNSLRERILTGQRTVKRLELHADILAGFYIGSRKRLNPEMSVHSAGEVFHRIGDNNFNSRNHHGTPAERVAASQFGFDFGKQNSASLGEVIEKGVSYVSNL